MIELMNKKCKCNKEEYYDMKTWKEDLQYKSIMRKIMSKV